MKIARPALSALLVLSLGACSTVYDVSETSADRAYFDNLESVIPQDRFWVPAEVRFEGTLLGDDLVPAQSNSNFANHYFLPVFPVVREAITAAVKSSFAEPYRADRTDIALHLNARSDALVVVCRLPQFRSNHRGGQGEMKMTLETLCRVQLPPPDNRELLRFPVTVEVAGMMNEQGTGLNGEPGPLWKAAAELGREVAMELQGEKLRSQFANREAFIERVHSTTGEPAPKDLPASRFGPDGKHGEYVEVVRLIRR
ncbi:MAG: hypothetical protein V2A76_00830 [Planctomycetota bacterium]